MTEVFSKLLIEAIINGFEFKLRPAPALISFQVFFESMIIIDGMSSYPWTFGLDIILKIIEQALPVIWFLTLVDTIIFIEYVSRAWFNSFINGIAHNALNLEFDLFNMSMYRIVFGMAPSQNIIFKVPVFKFDFSVRIDQDPLVPVVIILDINRGFSIPLGNIVLFYKKFYRCHSFILYLSRYLSRKLK